ncbi:hypothetical protein B0H12DRAFT_1146252 [Mycena haematopus]|nr:hypothetical protein B0H12DRAFT_1146252 [Mycena haematopus]
MPFISYSAVASRNLALLPIPHHACRVRRLRLGQRRLPILYFAACFTCLLRHRCLSDAARAHGPQLEWSRL